MKKLFNKKILTIMLVLAMALSSLTVCKSSSDASNEVEITTENEPQSTPDDSMDKTASAIDQANATTHETTSKSDKEKSETNSTRTTNQTPRDNNKSSAPTVDSTQKENNVDTQTTTKTNTVNQSAPYNNSSTNNSSSSNDSSANSNTSSGNNTATDNTTPAAPADESNENTPGLPNKTGEKYADMSALEVTKYLGNGINLGNTLEAYGHNYLGITADVSAYETYWGQPVTTPEMIAGMKACGFDSLRVPIAWTNMMDIESGDYTINQAYINRVKEIVNCAIDNDMFVIINDHWDGGWWSMFGSEDQANRDKAWEMYESLWTQLADEFSNYPEQLIFESGNEELGDRLNESTSFSKYGTLTENEKYETTNAINQKFVDIIRKSGNINDHRFLLLAGYNTDIDKTVDDRFKMPTDTADNKLFVSVHYYYPWNYCGVDNAARWGIKSDYEDMNNAFEKLQRFTNSGYGVIIGEYAAIPYTDKETNTVTMKDNTIEFTTNLLDNCDVYNYCPMLWSCNDLYNKNTLTMMDSSLTDLYTSRNYASEEAAGDSYINQVKERMDTNLSEAQEKWDDVEEYEPGESVAWIMWMGGAGTYSIGDTFNPSDNTPGITATNAVVDGAGEYTVSLDFENGNDGVTFSALGIKDAEVKYPGCVIDIKNITIDGETVEPTATPYTTSDDGKCTRVNLMNEWVGDIPDTARTADGDLSDASAVILDKSKINDIHNITITFELICE